MKMAIILCECDKKTGTGLDLKSLQSFLEANGQRVFISNKPCEDGLEDLFRGGTPDFLVVGGCRDDFRTAGFKETLRKKGVDPFAMSIVNLAGEHSTERAALLLNAQAERLKLFKGTKEKNLRLKFGQITGNLSRRQLFSAPKPRYTLVPSIEEKMCRSVSRQCRICGKECPSQAIVFENGKPAFIDKDKCSSCGICVNACPSGAIVYPYFTPQEIMAELEALLQNNYHAAGDSQAILFACDSSLSPLNDLMSAGRLPAGSLPVTLPCIGMLNSFLFLYTLGLGAPAVGVLSCSGSCEKNANMESIRNEMMLAEKILKSLSVSGNRLTFLNAGSSSVEREVADFRKNIINMDEVCFGKRLEKMSGDIKINCYSLKKLLVRLSELTSINISISGTPAIPAGFVSMDHGSACTFCGVCLKHCPSGALVMEENPDSRQLVFNYEECTGCAECMRICPEKALGMKRVLDTGRLRSAPKAIIANESPIFCRDCGKVFLNSALLHKLKDKLGVSDLETDIISLCPECRAKKIFSSEKLRRNQNEGDFPPDSSQETTCASE